MPYLLLALAAMFWGGNYVVGHLLVRGADPVVMTEARWATTAILLVAVYHRQIIDNRQLLRQNVSALLFLSLCGQVLFPLTLYIGLQNTSALNAAIYMSATPCIVLLINKFKFNEYVSRRNWLGVLFSTTGVAILILKGNINSLDNFKRLNQGDLWTMGSALSWAFYCSFLRKKDRRIPGNAFVAVSSLAGAMILLPVVGFWMLSHPGVDLGSYQDPWFLSGLAYLVLFPSWLSYLFWNKGIAEIGATRGEVYTHIIPLSGGLFSILFLGTQLHLFHLASALLIVIGIWLCSQKTRTRSLPAEQMIKARC